MVYLLSKLRPENVETAEKYIIEQGKILTKELRQVLPTIIEEILNRIEKFPSKRDKLYDSYKAGNESTKL
jgi:hypothetical protein